MARQAVAEARHRGRQLGPTFRPPSMSTTRHSSSSAATVASRRRRAEDRQHGSTLLHVDEASMNTQDQGSRTELLQNSHRHDALQERRLTGRHAASRGSMYNHSSSHQPRDAARLQPPERLLPRHPQLLHLPSSPRLRGSDNTLEVTNSADVLPPPDSSYPHIIPMNQQHCRLHSNSETGHASAQQVYSGGLPSVHQQHPQQHSQPWSGHARSTRVQSGATPIMRCSTCNSNTALPTPTCTSATAGHEPQPRSKTTIALWAPFCCC